jgi:hypothetical protein
MLEKYSSQVEKSCATNQSSSVRSRSPKSISKGVELRKVYGQQEHIAPTVSSSSSAKKVNGNLNIQEHELDQEVSTAKSHVLTLNQKRSKKGFKSDNNKDNKQSRFEESKDPHSMMLAEFNELALKYQMTPQKAAANLNYLVKARSALGNYHPSTKYVNAHAREVNHSLPRLGNH